MNLKLKELITQDIQAKLRLLIVIINSNILK